VPQTKGKVQGGTKVAWIGEVAGRTPLSLPSRVLHQEPTGIELLYKRGWEPSEFRGSRCQFLPSANLIRRRGWDLGSSIRQARQAPEGVAIDVHVVQLNVPEPLPTVRTGKDCFA